MSIVRVAASANIDLRKMYAACILGATVNGSELDKILSAARQRPFHIVGGILAIACAISFMAVSGYDCSLRELPLLGGWFFGCVVVFVGSAVWFRARLRAVKRIREVIESGSTVYSAQIQSNFIEFLPFGHGVVVSVAADDASAERLVLGLWEQRDARRLLTIVKRNPMGEAPALTFRVRLPTRR